MRNWQKYQNDDSILRQVVAAVQRQISVEQMSAEAKKLWRQKNRLVLKQGVLYRKRQNTEGKEQLQLVLPNKYHAEALNAVHDQMGHMGRERTQELLNDRFYWLNISKDVAKYISNCDRWLRRKSPDNQRAPLTSITRTYAVESCIHGLLDS